ncbi:MAG: hypothetical protein ACR2FO_03905 [Actinomycetota bacterium]
MSGKSGSKEGSASERQQIQRELLEEASKIPGVAEAMAAYASLEQYALQVGHATSTLRYATGANR